MQRTLKGGFLDGYPQQVAKEQVDRVLRFPLEHDTQQNKNAYGISLAITYNTAFRNLSTAEKFYYSLLTCRGCNGFYVKSLFRL